jgi:hypothetical protein
MLPSFASYWLVQNLIRLCVGLLFSNSVSQEQGNTIVNHQGPSSFEALSPGGIMLLRRRSRRTHLHHINTRIGIQMNKYKNHILIIHLFLISIKHIWTSTMLILHWYLRLARRRRCERVNTIQREQYGVTVHLFIGTRRSPNKITSLPLTSTLNHNANYQGLSSLFSLMSVSSFVFVNTPSRSSFSRSFNVHQCCLRDVSSCHAPLSQSQSFL